jgi:hypothetical protein
LTTDNDIPLIPHHPLAGKHSDIARRYKLFGLFPARLSYRFHFAYDIAGVILCPGIIVALAYGLMSTLAPSVSPANTSLIAVYSALVWVLCCAVMLYLMLYLDGKRLSRFAARIPLHRREAVALHLLTISAHFDVDPCNFLKPETRKRQVDSGTTYIPGMYDVREAVDALHSSSKRHAKGVLSDSPRAVHDALTYIASTSEFYSLHGDIKSLERELRDIPQALEQQIQDQAIDREAQHRLLKLRSREVYFSEGAGAG